MNPLLPIAMLLGTACGLHFALGEKKQGFAFAAAALVVCALGWVRW